MGRINYIRDKNNDRKDLKLAFVIVPVIALLTGLALGAMSGIFAAIEFPPWSPLLIVVPAISFAVLLRYYFKRIDELG